MRIVVDLEAAQVPDAELGATAARLLALALGLVRQKGRHEVIVLLNDALPDRVLELRARFHPLLPAQAIRVWTPGPERAPSRPPAAQAARLIRAGVIGALNPDALVEGSPAQSGSAAATCDAGLPAPIAVIIFGAAVALHAQTRGVPTEDSRTEEAAPEVIPWPEPVPANVSEDADAIARQVLGRLSNLHGDQPQPQPLPDPADRPRLAYVSPLPPVQSGIASYSRDLLPELARWYRIDVVADQASVSDPWVQQNCGILDPQGFLRRRQLHDRVLYHIGSSGLHAQMFALLEAVPGVVMLHDAFLGHALSGQRSTLARALEASHGFAALQVLAADGVEAALQRYPSNLPVLQAALGIAVHSREAAAVADRWYGPGTSRDFAVIPLLRRATPVSDADRTAARAALGLPPVGLLIGCFGLIGPSKLCHLVLEGFAASGLARDGARLVFAGANDTGRYGRDLTDRIAAAGLSDAVRITGWLDDAAYADHLRAADIGVQLRARSRGETSAAALDCMAHGLATVVNAHGSMAELDRQAVVMLPDAVQPPDLAAALRRLAADPAERRRLSAAALAVIARDHAPADCAAAYARAIEQFRRRDDRALGGTLRRLAALNLPPATQTDLAPALAVNFPPEPRLRQLLVDVSAMVQTDLRTGIQRVVRSVLTEWLQRPPAGWSVLPVYGTDRDPGYRYARRWTESFLGLPPSNQGDAPVDAWPGDLFLGLDLNGVVPVFQEPLLDAWHRRGIDIRFVVYDLLPLRLPQHFPPGETVHFGRWLTTITRYGGAVCISRAVAADLADWLVQQGHRPVLPFRIDSFRLGAGIATAGSAAGMPEGGRAALQAMAARWSFLMVGTVEPRKGHALALQAFEALWAEGTDVVLVIAGKQGWNVEALAARLRHHPEAGRRLFWFDAASDAFLERLYGAATALIAAP
jgi:glycosyltransferase involved in cell wall biosynthesis